MMSLLELIQRLLLFICSKAFGVFRKTKLRIAVSIVKSCTGLKHMESHQRHLLEVVSVVYAKSSASDGLSL
jgi:hypothetical protein